MPSFMQRDNMLEEEAKSQEESIRIKNENGNKKKTLDKCYRWKSDCPAYLTLYISVHLFYLLIVSLPKLKTFTFEFMVKV
jgi:hypothetical protein